MEVDSSNNDSFLDTVEGEISFFRSVMRARPVGIHRHFHVLAIRNAIHRDTGFWASDDDIWRKLKECYELDALEGLEIDGYDTPSSNSKSSSPAHQVPRSPSPSQNLAIHPYFRDEYTLPADEAIDAMISARRVRSTASLSSGSPAPSPPAKGTRGRRGRGRGRGGGPGRKTHLAGLVAGDSDSSALTQESGDEGEAGAEGSRLGSVVTGTDGGTEEPEGEEEEEAEPTKGRKKGKKATGTAMRTRRSSVSTKPAPKKRKRG